MKFLIACAVTVLPLVAWYIAPRLEEDAEDDWQVRVAFTVMLMVSAGLGVVVIYGLVTLWRWAL